MTYPYSNVPFAKNSTEMLVFLLLLAWTGWASGHAVVTRYSHDISRLQAQKAAHLTFSFNSQIELGLSQVFLVRKGDVKEPLSIGKGGKPGDMVVALPPLEPGSYALSFKVFAADGHLTEDIIRFQVGPAAAEAMPPAAAAAP